MKKKKITIKGSDLNAWKEWLKKELTPPMQSNNPELKYVLEAFLELIEQVEKKA